MSHHRKKKRRGAPPGNRNALKHGFYSAAFRQADKQFLLHLPTTDLSPEIELIRVHLSRFLEALNDPSLQLDIQTRLAALRAVNLSVHSILSLLRAPDAASILDNDDLFRLVPRLTPPQEPALPSPDPGASAESPLQPSALPPSSPPDGSASSIADQQSTI